MVEPIVRDQIFYLSNIFKAHVKKQNPQKVGFENMQYCYAADSKIFAYMRSIASTKEVSTNGMISVSQGQCAQMANNNAAVEIKKIIQYSPVDFFLTSMLPNFFKNKAEIAIVPYPSV